MLDLAFERDLEFAPVIVWDALVDPDLVSGWMGEAVIDAVVDGEFNLHWPECPGKTPMFGRITLLEERERLHLATENIGTVEFELHEFAGGNRGTSTRLAVRVAVQIEKVFAARVIADWLTTLDQLDDLLRGHPVDWAHWDRDRQGSWTEHYEVAAHSAR